MVLRRIIGRYAHWIAVPALAGSFVASCTLFSRVASGETFTATLFPWVSAGDFETSVTAYVDPLTGIMLLVVTGVGALIHLYSVGYMHDDPGYPRYFAYMNLFVFSMTMLVLAGNYLLLYVFWEAVGLCSYLLIGFWYTRPAATQAGKKAVIVNRVGDFGFGLGIIWLWSAVGTLDYDAAFAAIGGLEPSTAPGSGRPARAAEAGPVGVGAGGEADHAADRRARPGRDAAAGRVLLQGRDAGGPADDQPARHLRARAAGRLSDAVLYLPGALRGLPARP